MPGRPRVELDASAAAGLDPLVDLADHAAVRLEVLALRIVENSTC